MRSSVEGPRRRPRDRPGRSARASRRQSTRAATTADSSAHEDILAMASRKLSEQWSRYLDLELDLLLWIQARRQVAGWLGRLTSTHPLHDCSLLVWATFVYVWAVGEAGGYPFLFTCCFNLIVGFVVNAMCGFRCPSDVDGRVVAMGRVSPWGVPAVEIVMATVVFGWVGMDGAYGRAGANGWQLGLMATAWVLLVVSRVYGAAYFVYQVLLSVAWGTAGLTAGQRVHQALYTAHALNGPIKAAVAVMALFCIMAYVGYRAEHNGTPFLRIPKRDYLRVLNSIIQTDDDGPADGSDLLAAGSRRRRRPKVDGFVKMLRRMETQRGREVPEGPLFPVGGSEEERRGLL